LQRLGSWVVRLASNTDIPDAPSGFRAFTREAAMRMNVVSEYTYTLETIIQAGRKNMAILSVPVRTNLETRESRLFKNIREYVKRSIFISAMKNMCSIEGNSVKYLKVHTDIHSLCNKKCWCKNWDHAILY
jgi:hypothetical protein